jgi:hypothetical protein
MKLVDKENVMVTLVMAKVFTGVTESEVLHAQAANAMTGVSPTEYALTVEEACSNGFVHYRRGGARRGDLGRFVKQTRQLLIFASDPGADEAECIAIVDDVKLLHHKPLNPDWDVHTVRNTRELTDATYDAAAYALLTHYLATHPDGEDELTENHFEAEDRSTGLTQDDAYKAMAMGNGWDEKATEALKNSYVISRKNPYANAREARDAWDRRVEAKRKAKAKDALFEMDARTVAPLCVYNYKTGEYRVMPPSEQGKLKPTTYRLASKADWKAHKARWHAYAKTADAPEPKIARLKVGEQTMNVRTDTLSRTYALEVMRESMAIYDMLDDIDDAMKDAAKYEVLRDLRYAEYPADRFDRKIADRRPMMQRILEARR